MTTVEVPVHPEFEREGSFAHLRLGRKERREDPRTLQFGRYLDEAVALPATPPSCDWTTGVPSWPMYGNDVLGDCTIAAVGHMIQAWSAAAGGLKTFGDADVEAMYWETGDPPAATGAAGGPTDDGRDEMGVLNYWRQTGLAPGTSYTDKIVAYASVDVSNADQVRAAISLFGGVYAGAGLPLTAQGQSVWDVVAAEPEQNQPYSWGGHAIPILAYDEAGDFVVVTWGGLMRVTGAFFAEYFDEAYAIVSADFLTATGASPAGFDLERLEADLLEITQ
jgi:hypothetical protein